MTDVVVTVTERLRAWPADGHLIERSLATWMLEDGAFGSDGNRTVGTVARAFDERVQDLLRTEETRANLGKLFYEWFYEIHDAVAEYEETTGKNDVSDPQKACGRFAAVAECEEATGSRETFVRLAHEWRAATRDYAGDSLKASGRVVVVADRADAPESWETFVRLPLKWTPAALGHAVDSLKAFVRFAAVTEHQHATGVRETFVRFALKWHAAAMAATLREEHAAGVLIDDTGGPDNGTNA